MRDPKLVDAMIISTLVGVIMMTLILFSEFIFVGQQSGRLTWPYGDLNPGTYIARLGLPVICILVGVMVSNINRTSISCLFLVTAFSCALILTGERINTLILCCSCMVSVGVVVGLRSRRFYTAVLTATIFLLLIVSSSNEIWDRMIVQFLANLPTHEGSPHFLIWRTAINAFGGHEFFGLGPANYRYLCEDLVAPDLRTYCSNHQHNYFLQIVVETGLVGLTLAVLMFYSIIRSCLPIGNAKQKNIASKVVFVVPLALFFPLQPAGDFFGQWLNIFVWFALALSLAIANNSNFPKNNRSID